MPEAGDKSVEQALEDTLSGKEEVVEEKVETSPTEEVVEEKVAPKEDEDHSEKSRLGRRLTRLETDIRSFMEEMKSSRIKPQEDTDEIPEIISTPDDVRRVMSIEEKKRERARVEYESGYLRTLEKFKDDKEYDDIEKEMLANFNVKVTGNPLVDAELNYTKAKLSVTEKKIPGREFRGRAESPRGAPTIPNPTKATPKGLPELDEFARDFVRRTGMSEESQKKALGV